MFSKSNEKQTARFSPKIRQVKIIKTSDDFCPWFTTSWNLNDFEKPSR